MTNQQADFLAMVKPRLREYVETITQPSPRAGHDKYNCPLCPSGTGPNATGAFSIEETPEGPRWHCFSCGEGGDVLDLIGKVEGLQSFPEKARRASEIFGVPYEAGSRPRGSEPGSQPGPRKTAGNQRPRDYSRQYSEWVPLLEDCDYLTRRGISEETQRRFLIGYCPDWKPENKPNAPGTPRIIIPTSSSSYLARLTREPQNPREYAKMKQGPVSLFNRQALAESAQTGRPVFVVEGEIDALSIEEAGALCVGLGGVNQCRKFVEEAGAQRPVCVLVALDNDEAGQEAQRALLEALHEAGIRAQPANVAGEYKDPNEAITQDRGAFMKRVQGYAADPEYQIKEDYLNSVSAGRHIQEFLNGITGSANTPAIPTGFSQLDMLLDGGLYEGLYVVGAISSLGKTTFVCQIADQIAQRGHDVLIFSLEMARTEIMSKSISRHTLQNEQAAGRPHKNAKTARGITAGHRYPGYSKAEMEVIQTAIQSYEAYADHVFILEGIGNIDAEKIRASVEAHIRVTGRRPVVVVDYLQIVAPADPRSTDKQNTDKTVLELKRISRDLKTPVIGISSFNRESYDKGVSMSSFKESGAIEYSSDVLIGLQLQGAGTGIDVNVEKAKDPRCIELKILKNRNGKTGTCMAFEYYPMFNLFKEIRPKDEGNQAKGRR